MSNREIDVPRSHLEEPWVFFPWAVPKCADAVIGDCHFTSDRLGDSIGVSMGVTQASLPQPPLGGRTDEAV